MTKKKVVITYDGIEKTIINAMLPSIGIKNGYSNVNRKTSNAKMSLVLTLSKGGCK